MAMARRVIPRNRVSGGNRRVTVAGGYLSALTGSAYDEDVEAVVTLPGEDDPEVSEYDEGDIWVKVLS